MNRWLGGFAALAVAGVGCGSDAGAGGGGWAVDSGAGGDVALGFDADNGPADGKSGGVSDGGVGDATSDAAPGDAVQADGTPADGVAGGVTYHKDVEAILQAKCQGCHYAGGIAPWSLQSYQDAKAHIDGALASIDEAEMPPWGAQETDECKPRFGWQHDLRITPQERATLQAWLDAGTPEGDPADAPKTSAAPTLTLANPDITLQPAKAFVTSGNNDQYRCFVLDPQLASLKYLNGIQTTAGEASVVHHALVYVDEKNESAKLADADGQYTCFGGPGFNGKLVEAWAPGSVPLEYPANVGTPIPAGSKLVLQIHYHPAGKSGVADKSTVQIRWNATTPEWFGSSQLIGNFNKQQANGDGLQPGPSDGVNGPEFIIPANAAAHVETMRFHVPATLNGKATPDLHLYGIGAHMHLLGKDMKIWVERANVSGQAACTSAELDPLVACTAQSCPGATGKALVTCAQKSCATQVAAISQACGSCVQTGVLAGKSVQQLVTECEALSTAPSDQPANECLLQTPAWDFDWQRVYDYDAPIDQLPILRGGDLLNLRCTYDNTLGNPAVAEALQQQGLTQPVPVKLGETTLDEMCLAIVQVVYQ